MTHDDKLKVYQAQTENVREIEVAFKHINRSINRALRLDNTTSAKMHTKLLALTFSAWSEASFSKLIHTPYGLPLDHIRQIKTTQKSKGIEEAWNKAIELGVMRLGSSKRSARSSNIKRRLNQIVASYIKSPSLIRNKVAHGQWSTALNRSNTAVNSDLTQQLTDLDVVSINIYFDAHRHLSNVVEALIESPNKAFNTAYEGELDKLDNYISKTSSWTLEDRITKLKNKPIITQQ